MWTRFFDMYSGGVCKLPPYEIIYIEADEDTATAYMVDVLGVYPYGEYCECCGRDYSVTKFDTLEKASHKQNSNALVITKDKIRSDTEKRG